MEKFLKVKEHENLVRDTDTGAILNADEESLSVFRKKKMAEAKRKAQITTQKTELNTLKREFSDLKKDIEDIKNVLNKIVGVLNG